MSATDLPSGNHVGFARCDLRPCIGDGTGFRRPLEGYCAAFGKGKQAILLFSLDLIELAPEACAEAQQAMAAALGVMPERILLHTTHNHSAPWDRDGGGGLPLPGLARLLVACGREAMQRARPAKMRVGQTDVGSRLSVYRRADAGGGLGMQTFWFGYHFHEGDERADGSALANEMRTRWLGGRGGYEPGPAPVWFDGPVDPLVQAMSFVEDDGQRIAGSIVRFAAHPHLTSACRQRLYDPDYPARLRDCVEAATGAPCLFLLGPCADLVPKEKVRYVLNEGQVWPSGIYLGPTSGFYPESDEQLLAQTQRIGRQIGEAALAALREAPLTPLESVRYLSAVMPLPVDPALPASREEIARMRQMLVAEYEAFLRQGSGAVSELRRLVNCLNWLEWAGTKSLTFLSDADRAAGAKPMPLAILGLNDAVLALMPSELPLATTLGLRQQFAAIRNLWTVSLTGGSIEYIPTAQMVDEGGYEGRSACVARDAEAKLREQTAAMIREMMM